MRPGVTVIFAPDPPPWDIYRKYARLAVPIARRILLRRRMAAALARAGIRRPARLHPRPAPWQGRVSRLRRVAAARRLVFGAALPPRRQPRPVATAGRPRAAVRA